MEYRTLGRSGCAVSTLALGTMTFGAETDEAGAHAQLDTFVQAGGALIVTADVYSRGTSEEIVGRWLAKTDADVVLATKGRFAMGDGRNDVGLSRRHLRDALDASLRRLGVMPPAAPRGRPGAGWWDLYRAPSSARLPPWRKPSASSTTRCARARS